MVKLIKKWSLPTINSKKLFFSLIFLFSYIIVQKEIIYELYEKNQDLHNNLTHINITELKNYLLNKENRSNIIKNGKKFIDNCMNKKEFSKSYKINVKPVISSIIPVYNSERTIYNAICSIQKQNYTDVEIILINDYSTDNSLKIIKSLKEKDSRSN